MSKNSESLNRSLYALLRGKGYKPKMLTTSGKASPVPEEAAVFLFHFIKDGKDYGQVSASIDGAKKLIVYFDDEVSDSPDTNTSGSQHSDSWTSLVQQLSKWRFSKGLRSFELKNQDHLEPDMAQREHMNKKENVSEGYHAMGKQASYSDSVPNVKIVIQHSRKIEEGEQRYRNIARIFVENLNGERFLIPTTKPGIAQVYARHIAEGGTPYDDRAQHINSLVEEHSKMAGFVRATRNGQFNESTQRLVQEGVNHYHNLRETLGKMRGHRGYSAYFESWTPSLMEDESDTSNINELFVQETVDPRIESVMPILSKLQKNLGESSMKEVDQLAEWADSLLEGGDGGEASEETDGDTSGTAGEGGAEDSPKDDLDDLAEAENGALNPVGIPESEDDTNPVVGAITRRILLQRTDLLSKYGPVKIMQAIDDVADFVGDTDEIGSSDVSGWVRQVEQSLSNIDESALQAEDLDANQKRVGQLGPTEKVKNNNIGKLVGANENFIGMAPQAVAEGLHPVIIDDIKRLSTLNPVSRYSAYANIRSYFKDNPELYKMASDLQSGYFEADILRGKYKTDALKAKYAELEPMHQSFIKQALGQEQTVAEGQEDLDTIKRLLGEGWKGELAGGTFGGVGGTVAGSALGALATGSPIGAAIGGVVGGAAGGTAGQMAGRELTKEEQLNEVAPLLAAGARAIMPLLAKVGPKLGQMASGAGKAGAEVAGKTATGIGRGTVDVAKSAAGSAAQNAGQIGVGVGAYQAITDVADKMVGGVGEVYRDVGKAAGAIAQSVGDAIDGKTIAELASAAVKYSIPIGIILAVLYGGKKLIDQVMAEGLVGGAIGTALGGPVGGMIGSAMIGEPNSSEVKESTLLQGQEDLNALKRLLGK